jgi:hypothetical protein
MTDNALDGVWCMDKLDPALRVNTLTTRLGVKLRKEQDGLTIYDSQKYFELFDRLVPDVESNSNRVDDGKCSRVQI